jgi:hypothetical protein
MGIAALNHECLQGARIEAAHGTILGIAQIKNKIKLLHSLSPQERPMTARDDFIKDEAVRAERHRQVRFS